MKLEGTITRGFMPFTDRKEHTLNEPCDKCGAVIKATRVNGPAVADDNDYITGAFFLNLWLCRQCYERLELRRHLVDNSIGFGPAVKER